MMEIRVLKYFLTIAREESFTRAAEVMHISQPTLSRQIHAMEEEYGKQLFNRSSQRLSLTSDGILLRKHAEEIMAIVEKAENELRADEAQIAGDIYIGCGESPIFARVMRAAHALQSEYPAVHFHIITGDGTSTLYDLDKGIIDFAFMYGDPDPALYARLPINEADRWAVIMPADDKLAEKEVIRAEDLWDKPLMLSRNTLTRSTHGDSLKEWLQKPVDELHIANSYTMAYNAALMAKEGMGYVITFDKLITQTDALNICVRPLDPPVYTSPSIVWKKYQAMSPAAEKFLAKLREEFAQ